MTGPITAPGWYRITAWEPVPEQDALDEIRGWRWSGPDRHRDAWRRAQIPFGPEGRGGAG